MCAQGLSRTTLLQEDSVSEALRLINQNDRFWCRNAEDIVSETRILNRRRYNLALSRRWRSTGPEHVDAALQDLQRDNVGPAAQNAPPGLTLTPLTLVQPVRHATGPERLVHAKAFRR